MGEHSAIVTSTADLTPDGLLGYAKLLAGGAQFLGGVLAVVLPLLVPGSTWAIWVGGAIAVLGFIGTYRFPNAVKPVTVVEGVVPTPPTP